MKTPDFIAKSLTESKEYIERAVRGLTADELSFRIRPSCNSIAFLLWHLARVEDLWINRNLIMEKEIYDAGGWFRKFSTPPQDSGFGYDVKKLDEWPVPSLELLRAYAAAVRQKTLEYLAGLDDKALEEARDFRWDKGTVGSALSHLVTEVGEHTGQIGYIRGILKGIEPLPPRSS